MSREQQNRVRTEVKHLAQRRAMAHQRNQMNPLDGRGATPSMGLSMYHGGSSGGAGWEQGAQLSRHIHDLHGSGFWSDFGHGFMNGFKAVVAPVANVASMIPGKIGMFGSVAKGVLGTGRGRVCGGARQQMTKAAMLKHVEEELGAEVARSVLHMPKAKLHSHMTALKGSGFWDTLKNVASSAAKYAGPVVSAIAEHAPEGKLKEYAGHAKTGLNFLGYGAHSDSDSEDSMSDMEGGVAYGQYQGMGRVKKVRRKMSASDPRRKRAEIVRKVMLEHPRMKLPEASRFVKENGLWTR